MNLSSVATRFPKLFHVMMQHKQMVLFVKKIGMWMDKTIILNYTNLNMHTCNLLLVRWYNFYKLVRFLKLKTRKITTTKMGKRLDRKKKNPKFMFVSLKC